MQNELQLNDTYLEEIINTHYEQTSDDIEIVNKVLEYRTLYIPQKLVIKDYHYTTVFRKTHTLPKEILFDEKYVELRNITNTLSIGEHSFSFLILLTRPQKLTKDMGAKEVMITKTNLKEIYDQQLKDSDYMGVIIYGGDNPYPVSMSRIEEILKIEHDA